MINKIIAITGRPGLYRLVSHGKNMLIVESLTDGRRFPAYARDKVVSLADVSMYTTDGDEPLANVLEAVKEKTGGAPVDVKALQKRASCANSSAKCSQFRQRTCLRHRHPQAIHLVQPSYRRRRNRIQERGNSRRSGS